LYLDLNECTIPLVTTEKNKNLLLFAVCLAQFMVILDVSIVNVALPSIHDGLHFSSTGLQWVVNAYTLTFGGFLLLGGRAADLLGRQLVFVTGTVAFAFCSLACAVAQSRGLLLGARALQGLAGALLSPATLSIITSSFREGPERNRGLAAWGAMGGLGASSGALLGGILTQTLGWPAIFAVNVPLGAVVLALALKVIPAGSRDLESERHFDVTGAVLVTAGLATATFGIVRSDTLGWGSPGVLIPLLAALILLAAFVYVEQRVAARPLMPLGIFRLRQLRAANAIVVLLYMGMFASFFFVTLYLQQILRLDPIEAGLAFLPWTLLVFAGSTLAPRLLARFGLRPVLGGGMLIATAGLLFFTGVRPGGSFPVQVLPGAVLVGFGMGLALVSGTVGAVQGVPPQLSGLASGLLNTSRLVGGALGLAILSTIADAQTRSDAAAGPLHSVTDGYSLAFMIGAGFTLAGALAALTLLRTTAAQAGRPVEAPATATVVQLPSADGRSEKRAA
jgi:EmrB/QacA subfamily drug resistance transporter